MIRTNIEIHAFSINRLGNDLDVVNNEIIDITHELQQMAQEIADIASSVHSLNDTINFIVITDLAVGFAVGAVGAVKWAIAAGSEGAMEFGARTGVESAIIDGKSILKMGGSCEKMTIDHGALTLFDIRTTSISSQTGSFVSSLRAEWGLLVNKIKNFIAEEIMIESVALFTLCMLTKFVRVDEDDDGQIELVPTN